MSDNALTQLDWLITAAKNPRLHELAEAVSGRRNGPGRRREHPAIVGLLYILTAGGITGSHRSAARLLASGSAWRLVRRAVKATAGIRLPRRPPSRGQLETWRYFLAERIGLLCEQVRSVAVRQALDAGCFNRAGTPAKPRRSDTLFGDGKVVAAPILSKTAEQWRQQGRRIDTGLHKQAGEDSGVYVTGSKFALMGVRADQRSNARILLDVTYLPPGKGYGGEAATAVDVITQLTSLITSLGGAVNGVCYDGAFRGKHIDPLMKKGLTVLSPIHPTTATYTPLELITDCPCGNTHQLATQDGAVCESLTTDTGDRHVVSCPVKRLTRRRNVGATASHRWYQEIELDCGHTTFIRVDTTDDDRSNGFNRAERIRQHPPASKVYQNCYGWREDAESTNNTLDRTLYGGRMIAHTWKRQLLVMLGFALARNVLAEHVLSREKLRPTG